MSPVIPAGPVVPTGNWRAPSPGRLYGAEPWERTSTAASSSAIRWHEVDYASFGYLFGVRNTLGFRPLAAGRGLPEDLSGRFREGLAPWVESGAMDGAGWVTWTELAAADRAAVPEHFVGRVTWRRPSQPGPPCRCFVPAVWPPDVVAAVGPRPPELDGATHGFTWSGPAGECRYEPLTAGLVLGEGTHWPHVFAVMEALAGRFGPDGVRLVVAFD
ncbi:hypothetical protein ABZ312_11130 [Streptomyces sp. NPDC006207]